MAYGLEFNSLADQNAAASVYRAQLLESETGTITVHVGVLFDYRAWVSAGFVPWDTPGKHSMNDPADSVPNDYGLGVIEWTILGFFNNEAEDYGVRELSELERFFLGWTWVLRTKAKTVDLAVKYGYSTELLLYYPDAVYTTSQRPRTDMGLFRTPQSLHTFPPDVTSYPVTRYAAGMSAGIYHTEDNTGFCGTFYYHEPESRTYLASSRQVPVYFNKTTAYLDFAQRVSPELRSMTDDVDPEFVRERLDETRIIQDNPTLWLTPRELQDKYEVNLEEINPDTLVYAGRFLNLYAAEDDFDQILCDWGRSLGYDLVIFDHMVGSHQIVSEILDTRDRADSFAALVYLDA